MDTFCIPIVVDDETDLYEKYYPSAMTFSADLTAYLEDFLEDRKLGDGVILELQASQQPDIEHFRSAFHAFTDKLIRRNSKSIHLADLKAILFLLLGMAFVSVQFSEVSESYLTRLDRIFLPFSNENNNLSVPTSILFQQAWHIQV